MIMEVEELKEANGGEEVARFQAGRRERRRLDGFDASASQAISVASFSSWDHGGPRERPSSARLRVKSLGRRRSICGASSRSSRSFAVLLKRPQRAQAWSSASRNSSPSAV